MVVVVLLCALGAIAVQRDISDNVPFADEVEYVLMAHNFYHRGVLSLDRETDGAATPSAYREPGYPAFLAGFMALDPRLSAISIDCLTRRDTACAANYSWAKQANVGLLLVTGLIVWLVCWKLAGRVWIAHIGLLLCLANLELHEYATYLVSDFLALVLIAAGSLALYVAGTNVDSKWGLVAGVLLGLLVLTKAAFMFLAPVVLAVLVIHAVGAESRAAASIRATGGGFCDRACGGRRRLDGEKLGGTWPADDHPARRSCSGASCRTQHDDGG